MAPPNKSVSIIYFMTYAIFYKKPRLLFGNFATCKGDGSISHLEKIILNPLVSILIYVQYYSEIMSLVSCVMFE